LFAVEKNKDAFSTLKHNLIEKKSHFEWPEWLEIKNFDIYEMLKEHKKDLINLQGKVDLIVGGPPCQGFSMAGQRLELDKRNKLIHAYIEFIELVKPEVILFENVKGFTIKFKNSNDTSKRAYSEIILEELNRLGYFDAIGKIINLHEYGLPQKRQRFLVIASLSGKAPHILETLEASAGAFLEERGLSRTSNVQEALSDLEYHHGVTTCPDSTNFLSGIAAASQTSLQDYLRLEGPDNYIPDSHRFVNHTDEISDIFQGLLRDAPRNKRLYGDECKKYGVKKRNVTILSKYEPSLTITTIPDDFVHYSEPRVMTVRECARLQSFPDWYEFKGPYTTGGKRRRLQTPRYTQVGNAVPPLFAEQLGLAIKRVLSDD